MRWVVVLAAVMFAAPVGVGVSAQPTTGGRWSAGGGVGIVARPATCSFCSGGMWPSLTYRFGRSLRHDAVLAFEGIAAEWSGSPACTAAACLREPDASFVVATHAVTLQWYPRIEYPYFVKAGFGVSTNSARYTHGAVGNDPPESTTRTIVSLTPKIGAGVERHISQQVSFSLHADLMRAVRGRIAAGDASLSATLLYLGMSLTWYQ